MSQGYCWPSLGEPCGECHRCSGYSRLNELGSDLGAPFESPPQPCEYCSLLSGATQEHDGSCDSITKEQYEELLEAAHSVPLPPPEGTNDNAR